MSEIYDAIAVGGRVSLRRIRLDPAKGRDVEPIEALDIEAAKSFRQAIDDAIAIAAAQRLESDRKRLVDLDGKLQTIEAERARVARTIEETRGRIRNAEAGA